MVPKQRYLYLTMRFIVINVLIVDDESPARARLKKLLQPYPDFQVIAEAENGISALQLTQQFSPDVIFLDIEMPELNGIEVAIALNIKSPLIVFITAYDEFALKAFEINAIDYLLKPINKNRFFHSLEKIRKNINHAQLPMLSKVLSSLGDLKQNKRLAVKIGGKYEVFNPLDVSAVRSRDHYSCIIVGTKEYLSDESLDVIHQKLGTAHYMRIHRNAIINTNFLSQLKRMGDRKFIAKLSDELSSEILISKERLPEIKEFLSL